MTRFATLRQKRQHLDASDEASRNGLVWALGLNEQGVKVVGPIPAALPGFELPEVKWERVNLMAGSAFAIALLGLLEAVAMAKAIAARTGQRLDVNQQCLSEGAANLTGSFFQCIPGSGSLTRSAVNQQAGAVSQWSGVFAAAAVAATMLLFAPLAQYIPRASLAGMLLLAAYRMIDRRQLRFHMRATRFDAGVVIATALAAVLISIEFCIVIGVFLSFALYVPRAAQLRLTPLTPVPDGGLQERGPAEPPRNGLLAYELEGEVFFGAEVELAKHLGTIEAATNDSVRVVILSLRRARNPDAVFLTSLKDFSELLQARSVRLLLCGVQPDLMTALTATGLRSAIGSDHIFEDSSDEPCGTRAIRHAGDLLARLAH
jgi:sulfate permease, SulP family